MNDKHFYKRKLPHWQPEEEKFFITYRLAGSLPITVIEKLKEQYLLQKDDSHSQSNEQKAILKENYFTAFENQLENNLNKPHWLKDEAIAKTVMDSLIFRDKEHYTLWAVCIMNNHVHILISTLPGSPLLNVILQNHKKFTAVQSNKLLNRTGKFWEEESFDTLIRNNDHYYNCVNYILQNPVKAGLVKKWQDWQWTYLHPELVKEFRLDESS
ncbi:MAG: transposase [Chitinophagaceae bacterium]